MGKTHFQITQAALMSLLGNIATVVVAFVPAWSSQSQVIVATLGGLISNLFPVVNALHAHAAAAAPPVAVPSGWPVAPATVAPVVVPPVPPSS